MPSTRVDNDTFIHRARRTQIIDAAIEVVAEVGADRASISRIAERAGITRGVVTYHFRDRRSLFAAVVAHVYGLAHGALGERVDSAGSPRESLRTFIVGSLEFYAEYSVEMTALSAIYRTPDIPRADQGEHRSELTDIEAILDDGMRSGDFRAHDPTIMAATIRSALDAALVRVRAGADVGHEGAELCELFDGATRVLPDLPTTGRIRKR
ncbi:TetR/AcrR family transcriptional regulator [Gordonia humi]|uniref:AcrR family transcriptional regulator n=1 Tax=Gordonia humi TaxID=686429 RepID=A0A840F4E2_9ACTN|nr:TetR/AcrR family transcriptional regulator [Gordonia humi]MBB4137514.1 AcrR family transcriptional regulator [Gordonia humi]